MLKQSRQWNLLTPSQQLCQETLFAPRTLGEEKANAMRGYTMHIEGPRLFTTVYLAMVSRIGA